MRSTLLIALVLLPCVAQGTTLSMQVDNSFTAYADGKQVGKSGGGWTKTDSISVSDNTKVFAVAARNSGGAAGIVLSSDNGAVISNANIRCVGVASVAEGDSKYPGWKNADFNDNGWPTATELAQIGSGVWKRQKGSEVINNNAQWIWPRSGTVALCRFPMTPRVTLSMQVDNSFTAYADGKQVGKGGSWTKTDSISISGNAEVFAIAARNSGGPAGIVLSSDNGAVISNANIRCVGVASVAQGDSKYPGWKNADFNDNAWPTATEHAQIGSGVWKRQKGSEVINNKAQWIWPASGTVALCRFPLSLCTRREFVEFKVRKNYYLAGWEKAITRNEAKEKCQSIGAELVTLNDKTELAEVGWALGTLDTSGAGLTTKAIARFWIDGKTNQKAHENVASNLMANFANGAQCRSLTDWKRIEHPEDPFRIYSKVCSDKRFYLCESAEHICARNPVEPAPRVTEPPATVPPTRPPTTRPPTTRPPTTRPPTTRPPTTRPPTTRPPTTRPPTTPPTRPPTTRPPTTRPPPTRPQTTTLGGPITTPGAITCPKQRVNFAENGLDVEPTFTDTETCEFALKQCNDDRCYCVSAKKGKRSYKNAEVPLGESYDCDFKVKHCLKNRFKALFKQQKSGEAPDYLASCTQKGKYEKKQCNNSGECWCAKPNKGKEIKNTRTTGDLKC